MIVRFNKNPTTIDEQIIFLKDRGLCISDKDAARQWLETASYYRLSAYWLVFEHPPNDGSVRSKNFVKGATFDDVISLYIFDRKLRLLVLEAIERIEIHLRSRWTYYMVHEHGPHAHLDSKLFANVFKHAEQFCKLARSVERSQETFIEYYKDKYSKPNIPALWHVSELMSFGELSKWFQITKDNEIKYKIAKDIGLPTSQTTEGTLHVLSYVRNICAHHGRLWNRKTVKRLPKIKWFQDDFKMVENDKGGQELDNSTYNALVAILHLTLSQKTDTTLKQRLFDLLNEQPDKTLCMMGFPNDWRDRPVWVET
jgi:abortive infection bacteriophage resistance protein